MTEASPVWYDAAAVADLAEGAVIGRTCAGTAVALYRIDGAYHATADRCTHAEARLSEGEVAEGCIECPLHYGLFEIATGKALGGPVSRDLATYPVRVEGDRLLVGLPGEMS
ncbi:non-heme iron oxygenase ferredoxin subunit [uncultured Methylobacterium sp.]|jgi:nitrite reductase/ring-hydroxylating ferredoxin subunit|uniref:non-heme iron oxygenase ferredoxin subunit n=1 Tax=uncultured Methylobacterium sp. TaxID=157278 RepID=UPI002606BBBA|nr:non-heme iron oxygenase ferredoxin subunit [uncultured Methylobacterium sp.]